MVLRQRARPAVSWLALVVAVFIALVAHAPMVRGTEPVTTEDRALELARLELAAAEATQHDIDNSDAVVDALANAQLTETPVTHAEVEVALEHAVDEHRVEARLETEGTLAPTPVATPQPRVEHHDDDTDGEYDNETPESRLPRAELLRDIARPNSRTSYMSGTDAPPGLAHMISDTYEAEIRQQQEAIRINAQQLHDIDEKFGVRVQPECPLDGTFHQLRRFGHRLWYEGDLRLARACFEKAVSLYLNPTNIIQPNERKFQRTAPTDDARYARVLLETSGMQEKEFEDFGHVVDLIQQRTERLYSLPWSPVRPALHDRMLREGTLVHDPKLRALAQKRAQAKALKRRAARKARRANKSKKSKKRNKKSNAKKGKGQRRKAGGKRRRRRANGKKTAAAKKGKKRQQKGKGRNQAKGKGKRRATQTKKGKQQATAGTKKPAIDRARISAAVDAQMAQLKVQHGV